MNFSFLWNLFMFLDWKAAAADKIQPQEFIPLEIVIVVLLPFLACALHSSAQKHVSLWLISSHKYI